MSVIDYRTKWDATVIFRDWQIKVITWYNSDVMSWIIYLHKSLIQFILDKRLPSPLKIDIMILNWEEVWGVVDAIVYSPDERRWAITCKNMYYISRE